MRISWACASHKRVSHGHVSFVGMHLKGLHLIEAAGMYLIGVHLAGCISQAVSHRCVLHEHASKRALYLRPDRTNHSACWGVVWHGVGGDPVPLNGSAWG